MDSDGYPTKAELRLVKKYSGYFGLKSSELNIVKLLELLPDVWNYADWGLTLRRRTLYVSTAGWSGNEEVIRVLERSLFWMVCWRLSRRGGHYKLELPRGLRIPANIRCIYDD